MLYNKLKQLIINIDKNNKKELNGIIKVLKLLNELRIIKYYEYKHLLILINKREKTIY